MKFYLLEQPDWPTAEIDVLNFHHSVNYRDFIQDQMYRLPARLMLYIRHKEYVEYPGILLMPLPLFSKNMWKCIGNFMKEPLHTHFIFMDEKTRHSEQYYCPAFRRVKGRVVMEEQKGSIQPVSLLSEECIPEAIPALYVQDGEKIWVMLRQDLLESLMRMGLCEVKLLPIKGRD
ncbi:MAG: hypothetical protein PUI41_04535 [Lachnospiraceae bacterium]|nr:hypothetical protein [Lachnospiraceae bacterium]MDY4097187.1 hypothetical protein [Lachnospiraceae bacterium]